MIKNNILFILSTIGAYYEWGLGFRFEMHEAYTIANFQLKKKKGPTLRVEMLIKSGGKL